MSVDAESGSQHGEAAENLEGVKQTLANDDEKRKHLDETIREAETTSQVVIVPPEP